MRLVTWNIRHGANSKRLNGIVEALQAHDVDIIVITEFRNKPDVPLEAMLRDRGWNWVSSTNPPTGINGILIASRFEMVDAGYDQLAPHPQERWIEVRFPNHGFSLSGVHIPGAGDKWDKRAYWRELIAIAKERVSENHILIGDFNTGRKIDAEGVPFKYAEFIDDLEAQGWVDAFRAHYPDAREFTWYSSAGNGFRLDYAYVSPSLAPLLAAVRHSHDERLSKLSDHALLLLDLQEALTSGARSNSILTMGGLDFAP